ncbi:RNA ligase family protein [Catellatospora sichuanensis]|uniref:RNA ligase family protein n=1 Tax=Catellatospora sichuanensis TaxID=1969805 RepID=UPI001182E68E|nr:RNA ligase family protein [Catellatospora sichuanensis]
MSETYPSFRKIPRLHKDIIITEKIDGTNGLISIRTERFDSQADILPGEIRVPNEAEGLVYVLRPGSRNRWLTMSDDNHQFAKWVRANAEALVALGPGHHYGEWFGQGIQRGYGLTEKRFALFNVARWYNPTIDPDVVERFEDAKPAPACCDVVPVLWMDSGKNLNNAVLGSLYTLRDTGSWMVPGFRNPEGLIAFHTAAGQYFKVLLDGDDIPKSLAEEAW